MGSQRVRHDGVTLTCIVKVLEFAITANPVHSSVVLTCLTSSLAGPKLLPRVSQVIFYCPHFMAFSSSSIFLHLTAWRPAHWASVFWAETQGGATDPLIAVLLFLPPGSHSASSSSSPIFKIVFSTFLGLLILTLNRILTALNSYFSRLPFHTHLYSDWLDTSTEIFPELWNQCLAMSISISFLICPLCLSRFSAC